MEHSTAGKKQLDPEIGAVIDLAARRGYRVVTLNHLPDGTIQSSVTVHERRHALTRKMRRERLERAERS